MKGLKINDLVLPIALLSFEAIGVRYWAIVFNDTTRWLCLAVLGITVLVRGQSATLFRTRAGILLSAYLLWCICTVIWSEVPQLSFLKSGALVIVVVAFFSAGCAWTSQKGSLSFLLPIVALTLFAGLFDRGAGFQAGTITIYQGLAGNSNFLGAIVAMSMPYAIWKAYENRSKKVYIVYLGLIATLLGILWLSASRASMLCTLTVFAGFMFSLNLGKKVLALAIVGALVLGGSAAIPAAKELLFERFVVKGNVEGEDGALSTRQEVWSESYEQALAGGILGGGYGVTLGSTSTFSIEELGLSSVGYGREKGNTQLAIWEETGLVGLALYGAFLIGAILELMSALMRCREREIRIQFGLALGAIIGFIIQSIFEAWWVAPGSAESAFFWTMLGAGYGFAMRVYAAERYAKYARGLKHRFPTSSVTAR